MILRVLSILLFLLCLILSVFSGDLWLPFQDLDSRVRLVSYINYVMLAGAIPFFTGIILLLIYQLFHPKRDKFSYTRISLIIVYISISVGVLSLIPRVYLGYKVDQAGYVKCEKESRTSSRSSWRVYAKDKRLCKSSSGISGG